MPKLKVSKKTQPAASNELLAGLDLQRHNRLEEAETLFRFVPDREAAAIVWRGHAPEQFGLENVIACQSLTCRVQHREHAMGAIDPGRGHLYHAAALQQEVGEPLALGRLQRA